MRFVNVTFINFSLPICQTGIAVKAMKWTYLALVIDHNNVAVFINGNEVCRNATILPTRNNIVTSTDSFHFAGGTIHDSICKRDIWFNRIRHCDIFYNSILRHHASLCCNKLPYSVFNM